MHLTPTERDRLLIFSAAELARRRRSAGVLLNVPEATAIVADAVCEAARAGARHAEALAAGCGAVGVSEVLPEVPYVVRSVSVEAVFTDGSRLVVVEAPFGSVADDAGMPGTVTAVDTTTSPAGEPVRVEVENTASVPISVTSHFHFFEVNPRLRFDRAAGYGMHLAVPSGTHVRFEPGTTTTVELTPIAGDRVVVGFAGLVDGPLDAPGARREALARAHACGFLDSRVSGGPDPERAVREVMARRPTEMVR